MPTTRYQSWKGLGQEFAVVVIGILAALAVDDWRQAREDRATEQLHLLSSLIRDLESDSADQARQVVNAERVVAAGQRLLLMIGHPMAAAAFLASPFVGVRLGVR